MGPQAGSGARWNRGSGRSPASVLFPQVFGGFKAGGGRLQRGLWCPIQPTPPPTDFCQECGFLRSGGLSGFRQEKIGVQSRAGARDTPTLLRTRGWAVAATAGDRAPRATRTCTGWPCSRPGQKRPLMRGTRVRGDDWAEFCASLLI